MKQPTIPSVSQTDIVLLVYHDRPLSLGFPLNRISTTTVDLDSSSASLNALATKTCKTDSFSQPPSTGGHKFIYKWSFLQPHGRQFVKIHQSRYERQCPIFSSASLNALAKGNMQHRFLFTISHFIYRWSLLVFLQPHHGGHFVAIHQ
jgi:hypothetical protein